MNTATRARAFPTSAAPRTETASRASSVTALASAKKATTHPGPRTFSAAPMNVCSSATPTSPVSRSSALSMISAPVVHATTVCARWPVKRTPTARRVTSAATMAAASPAKPAKTTRAVDPASNASTVAATRAPVEATPIVRRATASRVNALSVGEAPTVRPATATTGSSV